jgi:hypothetical protein
VFGTQPRVRLSPTTGQPLDRAELYTEFNERKELARQMVALAEIETRPEYASRLKGNVSVLTADALQQFWDLEALGVSFRAPMDLVEEAIGKYKMDQKNALQRTRSPLFWTTRFIEWIIQLPVWIVILIFSVEEGKVARSWYGRLLSGLFWGTCALLGALQALLYLLDQFGLEKPLLHRLVIR